MGKLHQYKKGEGGRPKGIPNKVTREIRNLAQLLFDEAYWEKAKARLDAGKMHPVIEKTFLAYAFGEPVKTVKVSGDVTVEDKRGLLKHMPDGMVDELVARAAFASDETDDGTVN